MHAQSIKLIDQKGITHHKQLKLGAETNTSFTTKQLCMMNFGLARLPFNFIKHESDSKQLKLVLPNYQLTTFKTYAITTKRTLQPAKVNAALNALQSYFSKTSI
jgi:DNA-binding transcriptional LysR family regulator